VYKKEEKLKNNEIKLSDISILSAHEVDADLLLNFYNINYPERTNPYIWKWLNRSSFYDNKIPLVIFYSSRVIAHAGMIPFDILFDGGKYTGSWFIDFAVLPEFQKHGLGILLTKQWMEASDLCVTFCNEKAMRVFKKCGWAESLDTYLHRYFFMPFNHPKFTGSIPLFLRKILNIICRSFFEMIYRKYAFSIDKIRLDYLNLDSLNKFKTSLNISDNTVVPIRDSSYISWRLLNSPDRNEYRIFSIDGIDDVSAIIKICKKRYPNHIDLLWISNTSKFPLIRDMISTLAMWGKRQDYSYIRYYTSSEELSSYLKIALKPIVTHPMFAFYAKDAALFERLKASKWHWDLIDSDFERFF